jgi:hypothetical protein
MESPIVIVSIQHPASTVQSLLSTFGIQNQVSNHDCQHSASGTKSPILIVSIEHRVSTIRHQLSNRYCQHPASSIQHHRSTRYCQHRASSTKSPVVIANIQHPASNCPIVIHNLRHPASKNTSPIGMVSIQRQGSNLHCKHRASRIQSPIVTGNSQHPEFSIEIPIVNVWMLDVDKDDW